MNCARWLWLVGTLAAFAGCSGKYVRDEPAQTAGSGGSGGSALAPGGAGPIAAGGDNPISFGGASVAGAPNANSFCGVAFPTTHLAQFADPPVISARVQGFLMSKFAAATTYPQQTTRDWAESLVSSAFSAAPSLPVQGMARFMLDFWPKTTFSDQYALLFNGGSGLTNLLVGNPTGLHSLLLDPSVLSSDVIGDRGVYIAEHLLCIGIPPPHPGPELAMPHPGITRRDALAQSTVSPACAACHQLFDPLGYGLENYASDGRFRSVDNGLPIDSSGNYNLQYSGRLSFKDATDLAVQLSHSCEVEQCVAQTMLRNALASFNVEGAQEYLKPGDVAEVAAAFSAQGGDLNGLVRAVVRSDTFLQPIAQP